MQAHQCKIPKPWSSEAVQMVKKQTYVYFLQKAILSLINEMPDERSTEVSTMGKGEVMGLPMFWRADFLPVESIGEIPGSSLKLAAAPFREMIKEYRELNEALLLYC